MVQSAHKVPDLAVVTFSAATSSAVSSADFLQCQRSWTKGERGLLAILA